MAAPLRIKIGASVDQSVATSFTNIIDAAKKARAAIETEFKAAGVAMAAGMAGGKQRKNPFGSLPAEAREAADKVRGSTGQAAFAMGALADGAAAKFKSLETALKKLPVDIKVLASVANQALAEIEREKARAALGMPSAHAKDRYWHALGGKLQIRKPTLSTLEMDPVAGVADFGIGAARFMSRAVLGLASSLGVQTDVNAIMGKNATEEELAQQTSSAGYMPGQAGPNGQVVGRDELLSQSRQIGIATGTDRGDVLGGLREFVSKTGDLALGRDILSDMARLSKATGSNMGDMVSAAAEVANNLGDVPDRGKVIKQIMLQIAGQGKLGAVEIRDMASQMSKLASVAHAFEGGAATIIPIVGMLAQESKLKGGSASASQAATSVMGLARSLQKGKTFKAWQKQGLDPFTDEGHTFLKDPRDLIRQALSASRGDKMKLGALLPESSGMRSMQGFASLYNEAAAEVPRVKGKKAKAGDASDIAGLAAVNAEFDRLAAAQLNEEEITRAVAASLELSRSKATVFNEKFADVIAQLQEHAIPALEALGPVVLSLASTAIPAMSAALENLTPALDALGEWLGSLVKDYWGEGQQKKARADAATASTEFTTDTDLLNKSAESKKGVTTWSGEAYDLNVAGVQKRADVIARLDKTVQAEEADLVSHQIGGKGWIADQILGKTPADEDAANKKRTEQLDTDKGVLAKTLDEQQQQTLLLEAIRTALTSGTGTGGFRLPNTAPPALPTGTAPPGVVEESSSHP